MTLAAPHPAAPPRVSRPSPAAANVPDGTWSLADVLDYEWFLDRDERGAANQSAAALRTRDRDIGQTLRLPDDGSPDAVVQRRRLLRGWLEARRAQERAGGVDRTGRGAGEEDGAILPGEALKQVRGAASLLFIFLGLAGGWSAAAGALIYRRGDDPINALTFFGLFAVAQAALVLAAVAVAGARHLFPDWRPPSLARAVLRAVGAGVAAVWRRGRARAGWTPERAAASRALLGNLHARGRLHGRAYAWNVVRLTQTFAVAFNLGVLGSAASSHFLRDLDFGWESSSEGFEAKVERTVRAAALPWRSFVAHPFPTADEIARSRFRKRDPAGLDPAALKAWSPFLFAAVVTYGLLPRLLLLGLATAAERAALRGLRFHDARSATLLDRLRVPRLESRGAPEARETAVPVAPLPAPPAQAVVRAPFPAADPAVPFGPVAFVVDLTGLTPGPDPVPFVGGTAAEAFPLGATMDPAADGANLTRLTAGLAAVGKDDAPPVHVLLAAWTAPTVAHARQLDRVRAAVGPERLLRVTLLGKPGAPGNFRPVNAEHRQIWERALTARADPFLALAPPPETMPV